MPDVRIIARDRVDALGEGVLWSAGQNAMFWVDIIGRRVHRLSLADNIVDSWAMPEMIGWVLERAHAPGFIVGLASGIRTLTLEPLALARFADLPDEPEGNRIMTRSSMLRGACGAGRCRSRAIAKPAASIVSARTRP